jgi:hypothetical protein
MSTKLLVVALLCGQVSAAQADTKATSAKPEAAAREAKTISAEIGPLIKKESAAKSFDEREAATKELAKLYGEVRLAMRSGSSEQLVKDEYRLRQKLVSIVRDLNRKVVKAEQAANRQTVKMIRNPEAYSKSAFEEPGMQGGGTVSAANNLIQIIVMTIDPDGWQINGGTYTIEYWANGMALVVAAPADVHEAIGGSLGGLRTQGP